MNGQEQDDNRQFDDRARDMLRSLPTPELPAQHFRQPRRAERAGRAHAWWATAAAAVLAAVVAWLYPPALVNGAWAHVVEEQGLRGDMIREPQALYASLGLKGGRPLPGLVQLRKICMVDGHRAYHISTFVDGKGWVNILVFQERVVPGSGRGQWLNRHWQFLTGSGQHPVLLLSENADALRAVNRYLSHPQQGPLG
jgi:hypothetical protein